MEDARKIREELKLPEFPPRSVARVWLGYWPDSWNEAAPRAVRGEYLKTGEDFRYDRTHSSSSLDSGQVVPPQPESSRAGRGWSSE